MKTIHKILALLGAATLLAAAAVPASASEITRKFNGFHAEDYNTDGTSTYSNGVATLNFSAMGAGCWSYVSDVTDLHFQVRIDPDVDPEFDWLGVNVTTDGAAFLGHGTGVSTLIWRTSDSINCRLVQEQTGKKWDNVSAQELMSGELYNGESDATTEPHEDFRWGDGDWIDFHMTKESNGSWHIYINNIDIIRTPYKNFDSDMNTVFGSADKVTLSLFLCNAIGSVQVRGVGNNSTTTKAAGGTTAAAGGTTTKAAGGTTTKAAGTTTKSAGDATGITATAADGSVVDTDATNADGTAIENGGSDSSGATPGTIDAENEGEIDYTDSDTSGNDSGSSGSHWYIFVILAVVILAGAAAAVYFLVFYQKKDTTGTPEK